MPSVAMPKSSGEDRQIDIRRIENGWVIRESWTTKKGEYQSKETFSEKQPSLEVNTVLSEKK